MPLRNPFTRRPGSSAANDENLRPDANHPGFERVDTVGSKASSALSLRSSKSQDIGEYKMSVVNDSGVYLPPSPTEEKSQWPQRKYLTSRTSTDTRSSSGDIEPFSISRESFDSYRRSFDISARSPVTHEYPTRQSLESARFPRLPRSAMERKMETQAPMVEEPFEDVGLDDQKQPLQNQQPKKRGFFSKFSDADREPNANNQPVSRFLMHGRKRGQSGQGSELGSIEKPKVTTTAEDGN